MEVQALLAGTSTTFQMKNQVRAVVRVWLDVRDSYCQSSHTVVLILQGCRRKTLQSNEELN